MICEFDVAIRVIASDGVTERIDLNDHTLGLAVVMHQEPDDDAVREIRTTAPRVDGSFPVARAYDDGTLLVVVQVESDTWAGVETAWQAVRTAYRAESYFYVETEIEGVTKRWSTERPDASPAGTQAVNLAQKRQTYQLRFRVQPNPTITV